MVWVTSVHLVLHTYTWNGSLINRYKQHKSHRSAGNRSADNRNLYIPTCRDLAVIMGRSHSHMSQISLAVYSERGVVVDDEREGDLPSSRVSNNSTILSFGPGASLVPSLSAISITLSPGDIPEYSNRISWPPRTWTSRPVGTCRISTNPGEKRTRWTPTWANETAFVSHRM